MLLLPCPHCGPRNVSEFAHAGEAGTRPDPASTSPEEWRRYLYFARNEAGFVVERWYHRAGCRRFFTIERHTVTGELRTTFDR